MDGGLLNTLFFTQIKKLFFSAFTSCQQLAQNWLEGPLFCCKKEKSIINYIRLQYFIRNVKQVNFSSENRQIITLFGTLIFVAKVRITLEPFNIRTVYRTDFGWCLISSKLLAIEKSLIPHLKALILSILILERNWVWCHSEGGHALLTKKALLSLELVWSFSL